MKRYNKNVRNYFLIKSKLIIHVNINSYLKLGFKFFYKFREILQCYLLRLEIRKKKSSGLATNLNFSTT